MAEAYQIIYSYYEGNCELAVYLKPMDNDRTQAVLCYKRIPDYENKPFDYEEPVYFFSTNVKLDDIRDLYLAISTGDDIARNFYSVDEDTMILVNVDEGVATMKIVTVAGKEVTSDFVLPTDDVSYMQKQIRWFLEEVK